LEGVPILVRIPLERTPAMAVDSRLPDTTEVDKKLHEVGIDPQTQTHDGSPLFKVPTPTPETLEKVASAVLLRPKVLTFGFTHRRAVGDSYANPGPGQASKEVRYEDVTSTTTSVGGSVSATVGGSLLVTVSATVSASFNLEWKKEHRVADTYKMDVPEGYIAWLERSAAIQTLKADAYFWLKWPGLYGYFEVDITGPATDGRPPGTLVVQRRKLTDAELRDLRSTTTSGAYDNEATAALLSLTGPTTDLTTEFVTA
jgi:hypothetical protein